MSRTKFLVACAVGAVLVPMVASQGASAAPMTFMVTSTSCTGPGSITAAVEAANNNPGIDTIEFTPGLRVSADTGSCGNVRWIADVSESVIFEGNGAMLVGAIQWVTSGGLNTPSGQCHSSSDLLLASSPGFLSVGGLPVSPAPAGVAVEVRDLTLESLNDITYFKSDQGSLVLEDVTARRILSHRRGCETPAVSIDGQGASLTLRRNDWNQVVSGETAAGAPVLTNQAIQSGTDSGDLTIEDSDFSDVEEGGFISWGGAAGSAIDIVSTRMDGVGSIVVWAGATTNIVNSVWALDGDPGLSDRIINVASQPMNIVASTLMVGSADCSTACAGRNADGIVRQWQGGGPINLTQSAIGVGVPAVGPGSVLANADSTATGGFSADTTTWIQPVASQDADALKTLTGQPALLTDPPGLATGKLGVALPTYVSPLLGTTSDPGQLIDKIPGSACGGANQLDNPIDGSCITQDVFGNSRWDTGNDARNIGAVQLTLAPHLAVDGTGDGTVDLGWNRPVDGPGDSVTGYVMRYRPAGSSGPFTEQSVSGPDTLAVQVPGLTNGTLYEFEVSAVRATAGAGPASNLVTATPYGPIDPPTVTAERSNGDVRLFWTEPPSGGHPGPLYYMVVYRPVGATEWLAGPGFLSARTTLIPGLSTDTAYEFGVYAVAVDQVASPLGITTISAAPPTTTTVAPTTTPPSPTTSIAGDRPSTTPPSPTTSIAGGRPSGILPATGPSTLDTTWIAVTALAFMLSGSILLVIRRRPH